MGLTTSTNHFADAEPVAVQDISLDEEIFWLLMNDLMDGADHPEIWQAYPMFLEKAPKLPAVMSAFIGLLHAPRQDARIAYTILSAMGVAVTGDPHGALGMLGELATRYNESALVQGAVFHINALIDSKNPKYDLSKKFCMRPFQEIDVLDSGTHLCCASWLNRSVGNMTAANDWQEVWNSPAAEQIRASIHDGSYRYCNKTACPAIQAELLPTRAEVAARAPSWTEIVEERLTNLPVGPEKVNLAYDRTCNLYCGSCRTEKFAADSVMREQFDQLQERSILPMLKNAKTVFITGSGDPFASKNFRNLMERLDADAYPDLRFIMMTNGMLLTRREWDRFPALHGRVSSLQISTDGATAPTHEALRRGSRWDVMLENLEFAAELHRTGQVEQFHICYTVQVENYREMGDAVDMADRLGATGIYFGRVTNWGTYSGPEYQRRAVFQPHHPLHADFLDAMRDPRLRHARVNIGNLVDFLPVDA